MHCRIKRIWHIITNYKIGKVFINRNCCSQKSQKPAKFSKPENVYPKNKKIKINKRCFDISRWIFSGGVIVIHMLKDDVVSVLNNDHEFIMLYNLFKVKQSNHYQKELSLLLYIKTGRTKIWRLTLKKEKNVNIWRFIPTKGYWSGNHSRSSVSLLRLETSASSSLGSGAGTQRPGGGRGPGRASDQCW